MSEQGGNGSVLTLADLTSDYTGRRDLKQLTIPERFGKLGGKTVYYYDVVTVAEHAAAKRYARFDADGTMYVDEEGVVEGIMARLRDAQGNRIFFKHHKRELMEQASHELLAWIWQEIGGGVERLDDLVEDGKKN